MRSKQVTQYEFSNLPIFIGMGNVLRRVEHCLPRLGLVVTATGSDNYRFGFNGQEKDDEVAGAGNINTAMFWEYDTRLGRRWNIDSVVKHWQIGYSCFSNNPISRIDPKGDDDFFDTYGNYLGHTDTKYNYIRIVTADVTFEEAQLDVDCNTKKLSDFNYKPDQFGNRAMLLRIVNFYAIPNINRNVTLKKGEKGDVASTNTYTCVIGVCIDQVTGRINESLNISDQLISSFEHEREHEDQPLVPIMSILEIPAIMAQVNSSTFNKVTSDFKRSMLSYAYVSLNDALKSGQSSVDEVKNAIDVIMKSRLGNYGYLNYNEENNEVERISNLDEYECSGEKINSISK